MNANDTNTLPPEAEAEELAMKAARRAFATVVNSRDATGFGQYPQVFAFLNQVALVVEASKRKFQFFLMFPEVGGQDGCEMVKVSCKLWKSDARGYQVDSAINAARGILERRAAHQA